jgi:hypothetical protein
MLNKIRGIDPSVYFSKALQTSVCKAFILKQLVFDY